MGIYPRVSGSVLETELFGSRLFLQNSLLLCILLECKVHLNFQQKISNRTQDLLCIQKEATNDMLPKGLVRSTLKNWRMGMLVQHIHHCSWRQIYEYLRHKSANTRHTFFWRENRSFKLVSGELYFSSSNNSNNGNNSNNSNNSSSNNNNSSSNSNNNNNNNNNNNSNTYHSPRMP